MANDNDLIRRGDAKKIARAFCVGGYEGEIEEAFEALPAVTVGVKPLKWEARDDLKGLHEARGADGLYRNVWDQQNGTWVYEGDPTANPQQLATFSTFPTLEAAKAAAQADYEARILAALEAAPHVNETPKTEHDRADVLTDADLIAGLRGGINNMPLTTLGGVMHGEPCLAAADRIEALVKYRDAYAEMERIATDALRKSEARAEAAEAKLAEWQASQHYSYIGRNGKPVLARDLEARAEIAEAEVARLRGALRKALEGLNWAKAHLSSRGVESVAVNEADAAVYAALTQKEPTDGDKE